MDGVRGTHAFSRRACMRQDENGRSHICLPPRDEKQDTETTRSCAQFHDARHAVVYMSVSP
eukprot:6214841-Pleurochrysis_carterae.AAC.1